MIGRKCRDDTGLSDLLLVDEVLDVAEFSIVSVVLGFCPSLGVPLGDRLSSGDMALDVVEISIVLFVRSWFERLARLARR